MSLVRIRCTIGRMARLLAAGTAALALAAPALAQVGRDQAAAMAERQTGGRVLAVERVESGSAAMWRVKVVTPRGEVQVVLFEADAGRGVRGDARSGMTTGPGPATAPELPRGGGRPRNQRGGHGG